MRVSGVKKKLRACMLVLPPAVLSLAVLLPLLFLAAGSLKGALELRAQLGPVLDAEAAGFASWSLLPQHPTLQPYVELLLDQPQFFIMFWNSVKIAAGALLGQLLVSVPAAWWFARSKSKAGNRVYTLYVVLMLMPFQVTMVSSYLVVNAVGLMDTLWSILLPAAFSTFPVFILYRFFKAIPESIIEAAQIDGASQWQIFLHIGLPMGKAGVAAAMVLGFLEYWNLIEQPMTFLKTKALWPLSLYLPEVSGDMAGLALAASVVALLPPLLVFLYGQSYLEQGIMATGSKE